MVQNNRTIDGKSYWRAWTHRQTVRKPRAEAKANELRAKGYSARVVKETHGYSVYIHK